MDKSQINFISGSCQPYVGSVCAKYVGREYVFVTEGLTQQYIEQKLTAALTVITGISYGHLCEHLLKRISCIFAKFIFNKQS